MALHFSVDAKYHPKSWGVHKAWRKFRRGKRHNELLENCPEVKLFMDYDAKLKEQKRKLKEQKEEAEKEEMKSEDLPTIPQAKQTNITIK